MGTVIGALYVNISHHNIGPIVFSPYKGAIIIYIISLDLNIILGVTTVGVAIDRAVYTISINRYRTSIPRKRVTRDRRLGRCIRFNPICIITDRTVRNCGISTFTFYAIYSVFDYTTVQQTAGIISIIVKTNSIPPCGIISSKRYAIGLQCTLIIAVVLMTNIKINTTLEHNCSTTGDLQRGNVGTVIVAPDIKVARDQIRGTGIGPYIGQIFI